MSHDERPDIVVKHFEGRPVNFRCEDGKLWATQDEAGRLYGYATPRRSIDQLYRLHKDEFDNDCTQVVIITTGQCGQPPQRERVFSLDGLLLLGMFCELPNAKKVRHWIRVVGRQVLTTGHYELPGYQQVTQSLDAKAIAEAVATAVAQTLPQAMKVMFEMMDERPNRYDPRAREETLQLPAGEIKEALEEIKQEVREKTFAPPEPDIRDWPTPTQRLRSLGTTLPPRFNGGGSFDWYASDEHRRLLGNGLRRRDRSYRGMYSEPVIQPSAPNDAFLRAAFDKYMKLRWPPNQPRFRGM